MKPVRILFAFIVLCAVSACTPKPEQESYLDPAAFRESIDGKETDLYKLSNANDMEVYVTNFGAVIVAILHPDKDGVIEDIALGYDNVISYSLPGDPNFGNVVGRYGNRIGGGKFELDGVIYELPINETGNHNQLHGGTKGFGEQVWDVGEVSEQSITLSLESEDGDMGYPGNLSLSVTYTLTDENAIEIAYSAVTDAPTVLNITQHTYFNLKGEGKGDILDHELMINADHYTPVNERLIPTGEIVPVEGTPMDFTQATKIGERIDDDFEQLIFGNGYDHNWVLNKEGEGLTLAATVYAEESGRFLEVFTTEPGIQLYCGNFLDGSQKGKSGILYQQRWGLCLETQHYPDSPNQPGFPSTVLRPGEKYQTRTVYKLSNK
jgi:aldose 1-epimerase